MRYARIIETLVAKRWMITPEMHATLCGLVRSKLGESSAHSIDAQKPAMADRGDDIFGKKIKGMSTEDGVAVIPIVGVLANRVNLIEKSCGVCDYQDIRADVEEAYNDSRIKSVVLDIRSPGGTVSGCYETADAIARLASRKSTVAFTDDLIASAAYYLAAPCKAIVATPSSMVGSIGCILQLLDDTKAWEMYGYKVETFRSDELKAVGASGTTLSDQQRVYLQELVDEGANRFKNWVSQHRPMVRETAMDARVFTADGALAEGLIDRVVGSIAEAIDLV